MVITVEEARAYARDYESTDEEMTALIEVAESMIDDDIRAGFDRESPQAKMLAKLLVTPKAVTLQRGGVVAVNGTDYAVQLAHVLDPYKNEYEICRTEDL